MLDTAVYLEYVKILEEELVPAMGCTEPIAVAYCAARAAEARGARPESVDVRASASIIKNVKSVVVPNTKGRRGIEASAAAGIVSGNAGAELQVLASLSPEQIEELDAYLAAMPITVGYSEREWVFDIQVTVKSGHHSAFCEIAGHHTNVIRLERDGEVLIDLPFVEQVNEHATDRSLLNVEDIVEFAKGAYRRRARVLERQIECNTAIADEGLRGDWGANRPHTAPVRRHERAEPRQGLRRRRLRRAHERLRAARHNQLRQRQQGLTASLPVIVLRASSASRTSCCSARCASPTSSPFT